MSAIEPQGLEPPSRHAGRAQVVAIVPCYNHGRFVADAVRSCLDQPGVDVRVVVVDDGSDDGTTPAQCDACRQLPGATGRVEVIHQANAGLPAARNAGARHAFGADCPFILFLDADDYLEPTGLSDLLGAIHAEDAAGRGGEVSHAYGQQRMAELAHGVWAVPDWDPILLMVTNLHPPLGLVRRSCFEAAGGYDPKMRLGYEDWDFWLKMVEHGWRGVRVRKPVYVWRRHSPETMIHRAVARHDEIFAMILANHVDLYRRHSAEVIALSNSILRRADANWLDENRESITVRDTRAWIKDLVAEREAARGDAAALRVELERTRAALAAVESKPAVRISRAVHRFLDGLPRPIAAPAKGAIRVVKRAAGERR